MGNRVRDCAAAVLAVAIAVSTAPAAVAAGGATRGYLVNSSVTSSELLVLDPVGNTITDRIAFGSEPKIAVRPDGREVYASDPTTGRVLVVSTATSTVVATINVGGTPGRLAVTPDGRRVYVNQNRDGRVSVIDTATRRVVRTIAVDDLYLGLAISPDGSRIYLSVGANGTRPRALVVISTASDTVTKVIPTPDRDVFSRVEFAPGGRLALTDSGLVIDPRTDTILRDIPLPFWLADYQFTADGAGVYVADSCATDNRGALRVIDPASGAIVRTVINGRNPYSVTLTPDNRLLYAALDAGRNIAVLNPDTGAILDVFGVPDPNGNPRVIDIRLSATAPAAPRPGQRLAPHPPPQLFCQI
ncbi:MAG TPA: YncE family protein [Actinophytocola sp.]|uniref:YncE family protein n=1 Tax=Actinophytocola sp. TaxID=1872138 RepID=UPI002DDD8904|nr:YncE family protein [Actinophytocola sp.]HEV2779254.1 YncE family protein [Actinophytocola sp.]